MQEATHGLETMKTINFFITCAFAAATAAGASDAKERRLPDEGAFCLDELSANPISLTGIVCGSARLVQKGATGETAKR